MFIRYIHKNLFLFIFFAFVLVFFKDLIIAGLLPIPSDTIVGLYHPFLDFYAKVSPAGVPFQNFLVTDPIRQIIPWKSLVMDSLGKFQLPLWNPYEMAGKPLLANFQSSTFYPFNLLLLIKPFQISWSIFILLQPILAGLFTYLYLKSLKLDAKACLLGAVCFAFGGFSIAWLEWGNIVSTALWLPLILLSIDKSIGIMKHELRIMSQKNLTWSLVFLFSMVCSFFAGDLQVFFYVFVLSLAYLIFRWFEQGKNPKQLSLFFILYSLFFILTLVQWAPTLEFILQSARSTDQSPLTSDGWFLPFQNLIQFLAPDFFGNPATLNYWGIWNYGEFIGYIGVLGLFFAFCSLIKRRKETLFFVGAIIISLLFALPTPIAVLPFKFAIPFLSSAQPTRLIMVISFSLSILAAFGFDYLIKRKINKKAIFLIIAMFGLLFGSLWLVALGIIDFKIAAENLVVLKRNLILPTGIFLAGVFSVLGFIFIEEDLTQQFLIFAILVISLFDLYRFGIKFTPFTNQSYFYPSTKVIEFLKKDTSVYRIATTDSRILAPNIATYYKIQSIEGYDPLYLQSYAELIAASERSDHSIKPPFGFNRIVTPRNIDSPIIDLLNVKYVLALSDLNDPKLKKVLQEGQTRVYENTKVFPRTFFVQNVSDVKGASLINAMFKSNLAKDAFADYGNRTGFSAGETVIKDYKNNKIVVETNNAGEGYLVLTDAYYPTWHVSIDNRPWQVIFKTDYNFRGVLVPAGKHTVTFYDTLF